MQQSATNLRARVHALVDDFTRQRASGPDLAVDLFGALGWDTADYRLEPVDGRPGLRRLSALGETTAYLETGPGEPSHSVLSVANIAYNSGIDWAVVTNFETTALVHARWCDNPMFKTLVASEYADQVDLLEMLSPRAMVDGRLSRQAEAARSGRTLLKPVDEHLMSRLDAWRVLLHRQASDEQVHELIGRLFFVRSCEDRDNTGIERDTLLNLVEGGGDDPLGVRLNDLFARLERFFKSALFVDRGGLPVFQDSTLARIIRELYTPYPAFPQYRYDMSYLNVDLLGAAYQRYVSTVLVDVSGDDGGLQLPLFAETARGRQVASISRQRETAAFYTPPFLLNYIVQHTVDRLLKEARTVDDFPLVADISCGSAAFLTRSIERMAARARDLHLGAGNPNWAQRLMRRVAGVDIDPRAVTLARVNLWTLATMGDPPTPLPDITESIFHADALTSPRLDEWKGRFDVIVGNPPYRSSIALPLAERAALSRQYPAASGRFDIAYVFVERALQLVRPGGLVGLVLPNRLYTNTDARPIRAIIAREAVVERVVDFGTTAAFDDGLSYVTILVLKRRLSPAEPHDDADDAAVWVHQVERMTPYPGLHLRRADLSDLAVAGAVAEDDDSRVFLAPQPRDSGVWAWQTSTDDAIREKLRADASPLSSVVSIDQGIKTGADDVYILEFVSASPRTGLWTMRPHKGQGRPVDIEPDLLRRCARQKVIGRYRLRDDGTTPVGLYVLYPYLHGRVVLESELSTDFPETYKYLRRWKEKLAGRQSLPKKRLWYELVRERAAWLDGAKVLSSELVGKPSFAYDDAGQWVPVGSIALVDHGAPTVRVPLPLVLGVLNSSIAAWYLSVGSPGFRGRYRKVVGGTLGEFHFPWRPLVESPYGARIAALAEGIVRSARLGLPTTRSEEEIDSLVFAMLDLTDDEVRSVRAKVPEARPADVFDRPMREVGLGEALNGVDTLLAAAESTRDGDRRTKALIQARDIVGDIFDGEIVAGTTATLLAYALISIEHLTRQRAGAAQVQLVREAVSRCRRDSITAEDIVGWQRRFEEADIEIMPGVPGASVVLGATGDDADDDGGWEGQRA